MNDSKDHKAAAEPSLDCRVGHEPAGPEDRAVYAAIADKFWNEKERSMKLPPSICRWTEVPYEPEEETMQHNIHAFTELHTDYPAYISINRDESGQHSITVRRRGNGGRDMAKIELSPEQLESLAIDVLAHLHQGDAFMGEPVVPNT